ncbi:Endo-1,4-beta-xylanase A precursor [Aquisphaera giovannonii]|uniref:Beta-xylanase n=1 Tax=Aquisphaera giovannonii TaxID=406548 RepID=A0A5B9WE78_9BACT|nr:endo-1,4-beta-xylanase [Aquisphaera giovannonii]QEH38514.1 Endo-1,4-beta-xylanase A precursor [Aquisphaera giovannonii]
MGRPRPRRLLRASFAIFSLAAIAAGGPAALGQPGGKPADPKAAPAAPAASPSAGETLRHAARGRFLVGAAVSSWGLNDPKVAGLVASQFDSLTAENEFKPASLSRQPGQYRFEAADRFVEFARAHDMKLVGHNLCWHSQAPAWLFRGQDNKPLPRDQALKNLKDHIDAVAGHFKGKVIGWDVVNEAISDAKDEYLRKTPALRAIGDDYIAKAFEFAHAADPGAELYYNDYSNENPVKREKTVRLVRELKAKGVRIDAVGMQCHFVLSDADAIDKLDQSIAAYAAEGVKVAITELDVDVLPRRGRVADIGALEKGGDNPYKEGLPPAVAEAQARFYARLFEVVLKRPGVVNRVTFWGVHDGASWLNGFPVRGRTNHPLLWDRQLKPKPAFGAVLDVLARP